MGYHIIQFKNGSLLHEYVDSIEMMAHIDSMNENSFVYIGDRHCKPYNVARHNKYKTYLNESYRADIQARELFLKEGSKRGYILETLCQQNNSYQPYNRKNQKISIKQGHFIIRNLGNIELSVKCKTFYDSDGDLVFYEKIGNIKKYQNMQKLTNTPIIIAVYKKVENKPEGEAYLVSVESLINAKDLSIINHQELGKCYEIPLCTTNDSSVEGFWFLEKTYQNHQIKTNNFNVAQLIEAQNFRLNPNWTPKDDVRLKELLSKGYTIKTISKILDHHPESVFDRMKTMRINK